jgi:acetyl-CoA carboxylase biotin carboxyl carrier protein
LDDPPSQTPRPFDVRTIAFLVRLMRRHDLSEIDLHEGDQRIRLRRGGPPMAMSGPSGTAPPSRPPVEQAAPVPVEKPAPARKLTEIKSLTVGTFYAQKEPGAPPYVTVGSRVAPTTVVCIIEAMKVMNEIQAECAGVIEEIVVNNGDFVEYGTVLFRVNPSA